MNANHDATYVGRYAPSPTGDLHLGNVLAALIAVARAQQHRGVCLLRIEDLDPARARAGATERIINDLEWLGLRFWDDDQVLMQSARRPAYDDALASLRKAGLLFGCRCTRKDLREAASAPHGPDGPAYPGTCVDAGYDLDEPGIALRFMPPAGEVLVDDALAGPFVQDVARDVGAFVVRRKDGVVAYQLAVVVDDAAQGITEIVRGRDLLDSAPRQVRLYEALNKPAPRFAHHGVLADATGRRLAKRDGDLTMRAMRHAGAAPADVLERLTRALGLSLHAPDRGSVPAVLAALSDEVCARPVFQL